MNEAETNKPAAVKNSAEANILRPEREWPYRLAGNFLVLLVIFLIAAIILTLKNDLVTKRINEGKEAVFDWAAEQGLTLSDVVITGRERTTLSEINQALNLKRGDNMLRLNPYDLKQKLEQLPWVRAAEVRRSFFPNVIKIELHEKEVRAIWQLKEKFYPIDGDGKVIHADFRAREPMLLIVGEGAPENLKNLLTTIQDDGDVYLKRIKVANFISGRRWNLVLDDIRHGITIKLPEDKIEEAWKKLLKLNETKGILKRKLTIIDLRLEDKITVKLRKTRPEEAPQLKKNEERKL